MGSFTLAIIALALAQLAVVVRVSMHFGGAAERDKQRAERDKERDAEIAALKAQMQAKREEQIRLEERAKRLGELIDELEGLEGELALVRDELRAEVKRIEGVIGAWASAGDKLAFRIENMEKMATEKLGSHPRIYATRPEPVLRTEARATAAQLPAVTDDRREEAWEAPFRPERGSRPGKPPRR